MKPGDVVALKSGSVLWTIASVDGEWVRCATESIPELRTFHIATIWRILTRHANDGEPIYYAWLEDGALPDGGRWMGISPPKVVPDVLPQPIDTSNSFPMPPPIGDQLTSPSPMEKAH